MESIPEEQLSSISQSEPSSLENWNISTGDTVPASMFSSLNLFFGLWLGRLLFGSSGSLRFLSSESDSDKGVDTRLLKEGESMSWEGHFSRSLAPPWSSETPQVLIGVDVEGVHKVSQTRVRVLESFKGVTDSSAWKWPKTFFTKRLFLSWPLRLSTAGVDHSLLLCRWLRRLGVKQMEHSISCQWFMNVHAVQDQEGRSLVVTKTSSLSSPPMLHSVLKLFLDVSRLGASSKGRLVPFTGRPPSLSIVSLWCDIFMDFSKSKFVSEVSIEEFSPLCGVWEELAPSVSLAAASVPLLFGVKHIEHSIICLSFKNVQAEHDQEVRFKFLFWRARRPFLRLLLVFFPSALPWITATGVPVLFGTWKSSSESSISLSLVAVQLVTVLPEVIVLGCFSLINSGRASEPLVGSLASFLVRAGVCTISSPKALSLTFEGVLFDSTDPFSAARAIFFEKPTVHVCPSPWITSLGSSSSVLTVQPDSSSSLASIATTASVSVFESTAEILCCILLSIPSPLSLG